MPKPLYLGTHHRGKARRGLRGQDAIIQYPRRVDNAPERRQGRALVDEPLDCMDVSQIRWHDRNLDPGFR